MTTSRPEPTVAGHVAPLYAAGFVTAFGAHGIAANLGVYTHDRHDPASGPVSR